MTRDRIRILVDACRSARDDRQRRALRAIGHHRVAGDEIIGAVLAILRSAESQNRELAVSTLGVIGEASRDVLRELLRCVADDDVSIRAECCYALSEFRDHAVPLALTRALHSDPSPFVRASAAEALGALDASDAAEALNAALRDGDETVRAYAALSLGRVGGSAALHAVQRHLDDETSSAVRAELFGAAYRLGDRGRLSDLLALLPSETSTSFTGLHALIVLQDLVTPPRPAGFDADRETLWHALSRVPGGGSLDGDLRKLFRLLEGRDPGPPYGANPFAMDREAD